MKDRDKTKKQLINELIEMRRRIAELEISEIERKRAEEALKRSEEKYRILAENAMDGIYIITPEGFEYVNPAFEKIFGFKAKEVCNKNFNFFDLIHPEDRKLIAEREEARKKGKRLPPHIFI
jgi:PAS domain-containing protein